MPDNSSPDVLNGKSDTLPWCSISVDRPLELVKAEITVTAPREANVLEWVLGRILSEFGEEMPCLQEAATELGLKDTAFLRDTLVGLAEIGAVELINTTQPLDLRNVRLTTAGRELLREGRTPSLAEHHGVELLFDPVTGEHVAKRPRTARRKPEIPIIQPDQLPERIQAIGLDRVRDLCSRQGEPFHQGESRIVDVTVHVAEGSHLWSPVAVSLGIDRAGVLHADLSAGRAWQAWFNEHGWSLGPLQALDEASTGAWANGRSRVRVPPVSADRWMETIDCAVPPESALAEATRLVDSAREEVVVHTGWLDAPGFEAALVRGASRGVRCFVCGARRALAHWSATDGRTPGFVASGGDVARPRAFAVVVDRAHGLSVDLVCVRTPGGRELTIEIAATAKPTSVPALHRELTADVADSLATDDSRELFAAFALTGRIGLWEQGTRLVEVQADGPQRVEELHRWARWGQSLGLEETTGRRLACTSPAKLVDVV